MSGTHGTTGRDRLRSGGGGERLSDRELVRFVHGEVAPERAAEIRRRSARDANLAARLRRLEAAWDGLDLPPAEPAPPGFAGRVAARARSEAGEEPAAFRPAWVRAVAAAALTVGVGVGAALGSYVLPGTLADGGETLAGSASGESPSNEALSLESVPSLAESYWTVVAPDATSEDGPLAEERR